MKLYHLLWTSPSPKRGLQYQKNLYNGNVETTQFPPAHKTCMESSNNSYNFTNIYIKKIHYYKLGKFDVFDIFSVFFDVIYKF